jgi:A/G-specific adenine glycosylase
VLLGRRKTELVFGGMWEPPGVDADDDGRDARLRLRELVGVPLRGLAPAGEVTHVLSHRRMEVAVLRGSLGGPPKARARGEYDAFAVVDREQLERRGISALARKLLAVAGD